MVERDKLIRMVQGLQQGDPDAATELFETFQKEIYFFILKTVKNDHELAEDLTQDTFLEILETIDKLQEPAAFVTWSRQIAYHKCTAYFRKRTELLVDENEDGYTVFDTMEEEREEFIPGAALDHEELKKSILAMINDLPQEQRSAIVLRYFNEASVKEIAQIQGVTEGTVKSRLNYGRKSIKQAVEEYEKKTGIRLHCAGVLPLLLWFFKNYRIQSNLHMTSKTAAQVFALGEEAAGAAAAAGSTAAAGSAAAGSAAAGSTAAAGTAVTTGTVATTAAAAGKAGVAGFLSTKVIAIVAAASVTIGGVSIGVASVNSRQEAPEQSVVATYEDVYTDPFEEETVITEPTEAPTEAPTEEPTEAPTEEATQAPEQEFTQAPTEAPEQAPTDPPTEPPTEPSTEPPVTEAPEDDSGCDHSMILVDQLYGYSHVNETWQCTKCGAQSFVNYPNPCSHVGQLREDYIMVCVNCGLAMGYYPPEETTP